MDEIGTTKALVDVLMRTRKDQARQLVIAGRIIFIFVASRWM
jgi:hypothetical protein